MHKFSNVGLKTPREFLDHVVTPDIAAFANHQGADLRVAYHACISLLSLRDWVVRAHHGKAWKYKGLSKGTIHKERITKGFQAELVQIDNAFAAVFDIANASKHMVLDRGLTALQGASNLNVQNVGSSILGEAIIGDMVLGSHGTLTVFVDIAGSRLSVLPLAQRVFEIWRDLFQENGW